MTIETAPPDGGGWLEEWRAWYETDLDTEVHGLLRQREVLRSWSEIVSATAAEVKGRGLFIAWVNSNYVTAVAIGIRRMCDDDGRTRSLMRMLKDLEQHSGELTRHWWARRWLPEGTEPTELYLAEFDRLSSGCDHVDPAVVQLEIEHLAEACEKVSAYVNKYVAHIDRNRSEVGPVFLADLHSAIDVIYRIFHRWYQLATNTVLSVPIVEPWESSFTSQWISPESADTFYANRVAEAAKIDAELRAP